MENNIIIIGIILLVLFAVFAITGIYENFHIIKRLAKCTFEVIGEKLFDLETDFYKWRFDVKRRKRG